MKDAQCCHWVSDKPATARSGRRGCGELARLQLSRMALLPHCAKRHFTDIWFSPKINEIKKSEKTACNERKKGKFGHVTSKAKIHVNKFKWKTNWMNKKEKKKTKSTNRQRLCSYHSFGWLNDSFAVRLAGWLYIYYEVLMYVLGMCLYCARPHLACGGD